MPEEEVRKPAREGSSSKTVSQRALHVTRDGIWQGICSKKARKSGPLGNSRDMETSRKRSSVSACWAAERGRG